MANKISTSQKRIAEMMEILKITQADIVKRTKIPKSTLSNYLSGKRIPDQEHLSILADPYGIDPSWLMGYDVPMKRHNGDYPAHILRYAEILGSLRGDYQKIVLDAIELQEYRQNKEDREKETNSDA